MVSTWSIAPPSLTKLIAVFSGSMDAAEASAPRIDQAGISRASPSRSMARRASALLNAMRRIWSVSA
jgi:hypothetical protein